MVEPCGSGNWSRFPATARLEGGPAWGWHRLLQRWPRRPRPEQRSSAFCTDDSCPRGSLGDIRNLSVSVLRFLYLIAHQREEDADLSSCWVTPQLLAIGRAGPGRGLEPGTPFWAPTRVAGAPASTASAGSWIRSRAARTRASAPIGDASATRGGVTLCPPPKGSC